jgi:hypothetical protein
MFEFNRRYHHDIKYTAIVIYYILVYVGVIKRMWGPGQA